jgi:hypothetical protein
MLQVPDKIIEDDDIYQTILKEKVLIENQLKEDFTCIGSKRRCLTSKRKRFICCSSCLLIDLRRHIS